MLGLNTKEYSSAAEFTKKKKQPLRVLKTVPVPGSLATCCSVKIQINEAEKKYNCTFHIQGRSALHLSLGKTSCHQRSNKSCLSK
jgi:hypothetical protein